MADSGGQHKRADHGLWPLAELTQVKIDNPLVVQAGGGEHLENATLDQVEQLVSGSKRGQLFQRFFVVFDQFDRPSLVIVATAKASDQKFVGQDRVQLRTRNVQFRSNISQQLVGNVPGHPSFAKTFSLFRPRHT